MSALENLARLVGGGLTSAARRGLARLFFPYFHERGFSANRALGLLRSAGLGYRRQDFLRDYRESLERYALSTRVRFVREDRVPTERILQERYFGVPDRYSFKFKVTVRDLITEETRVKYFFLHTDKLRRRVDLEAAAIQYMVEHYELDNFEVIERAQLWEGYVNPIWSSA